VQSIGGLCILASLTSRFSGFSRAIGGKNLKIQKFTATGKHQVNMAQLL